MGVSLINLLFSKPGWIAGFFFSALVRLVGFEVSAPVGAATFFDRDFDWFVGVVVVVVVVSVTGWFAERFGSAPCSTTRTPLPLIFLALLKKYLVLMEDCSPDGESTRELKIAGADFLGFFTLAVAGFTSSSSFAVVGGGSYPRLSNGRSPILARD